MNSSMYLGAHIKYTSDLPGISFERFSWSSKNSAIKEVVFEKSDSNKTKCYITFYLGPVLSLQEAQEICEPVKDKILNLLSLELNTKVGTAKLIGHGLTPRAGEGASACLMFPPFNINSIGEIEYKLSSEDIKNIQIIFDHVINPKGEILIKLFRHALQLDDIVSQFLLLYLILDIITSRRGRSSQYRIDSLILRMEPTTPTFPRPDKPDKQESCYTKLRNEIIHRTEDPEKIRNEIRNNIDSFKKIIKKIIKQKM